MNLWRVKKMAYKLINEWKSPEGLNEHEITVYKYNLNHDEMIRYFKGDGDFVEKKTFFIRSEPTKTEIYFKRD